jgi:hypothetical protein
VLRREDERAWTQNMTLDQPVQHVRIVQWDGEESRRTVNPRLVTREDEFGVVRRRSDAGLTLSVLDGKR